MHLVNQDVTVSLSWLFVIILVRVAEYLDVDEKSTDYNDVPPALMTRDILAKFRTLEVKSQQDAIQQLPLQQRHVCDPATCFHYFYCHT